MFSERMVQCPYNPSHVVLKTRLANHILKCRQQHRGEKYETCPFNSVHDVPGPELQYHIQNCPDRKSLESYMYVMEDSKPATQTVVNVDIPPAPENWDEECYSGSYLNVKDERLENEMLFRLPTGLSKSKRKEFCRKEVEKFQRLSQKSKSENEK